MNATEIARKLTQLGVAFTPNAYMRTARPALFSDTRQRQQVSLLADQFEFYLDQLTAKKRESQFEEFGRRLAQLEICPNLLPQTGPTGGGDSKTDAATYPVAEALAKRCCWVGSAGPSDGDWAFAMSCMKKWRDKLQSDVAKIAALPRKFTKVSFLPTNRYGPGPGPNWRWNSAAASGSTHAFWIEVGSSPKSPRITVKKS